MREGKSERSCLEAEIDNQEERNQNERIGKVCHLNRFPDII